MEAGACHVDRPQPCSARLGQRILEDQLRHGGAADIRRADEKDRRVRWFPY